MNLSAITSWAADVEGRRALDVLLWWLLKMIHHQKWTILRLKGETVVEDEALVEDGALVEDEALV